MTVHVQGCEVVNFCDEIPPVANDTYILVIVSSNRFKKAILVGYFSDSLYIEGDSRGCHGESIRSSSP